MKDRHGDDAHDAPREQPANPFDVPASPPTPAPPAPEPRADEESPELAVGFDESWRFRRWLLDAARGQAREARSDLAAEHFGSLADEAEASLADQPIHTALQAAYDAWQAERGIVAGFRAEQEVPESAWRAWSAFFREVLQSQGVLLVPHAAPITEAILAYIEARRPRRRSYRAGRPPGRPPLDEAEALRRVDEGLTKNEERARRSGLAPGSLRTLKQIAHDMGISVRRLEELRSQFEEVRRRLP